MATSNDYSFNMTRDEIIREAFEIIGVYNPADTMSSEDLQKGVRTLNLMIRSWEANKIYLWTNQEAIVFPVIGQAKYVLGPTGDKAGEIGSFIRTAVSTDALAAATSLFVDDTTGMTVADRIGIKTVENELHWTTIATIPTSTSLTINNALPDDSDSGSVVYSYTTQIQKPLFVTSVRRRDNQNLDQALTGYARDEYMSLPAKSDQGTPSVFYYHPLTTTGILYIYQTPSNLNEVFHIDYIRPVQDFVNSGDDAEFPTQWLETIIWNLAIRLAASYGKSAKAESISPYADKLFDELASSSFDSVNAIIQPKTDY